jgi:hypothetical protein
LLSWVVVVGLGDLSVVLAMMLVWFDEFLLVAQWAFTVDYSTSFSCFSSLFSAFEACFFPRTEPK